MDKYYENDKKKALLQAFKMSFTNKSKPQNTPEKKSEEVIYPKNFRNSQNY